MATRCDGAIATKKGVSVLICTLNGAKRLPQCLDALSKCDFGQGGEVVLVDNNSTDESAVVAEAHWAAMNNMRVPLRIVTETKRGSAWARRAGVLAAQYDLIVFCDDDNLLAPDYLMTASEIMDNDPSLGALGGGGILRTIDSPPPHFYTFASWYAVGAQVLFNQDPEYAEQDVLWGAGMVVRRADMLRLYDITAFPILRGEITNEDIEISHALALSGRRLVYSSRLLYEHALDAERFELSHLRQRWDWSVQAAPILSCYRELRKVNKEAAWKTVSHFPLRLVRDVVSNRSVRPLWFGLLAALQLPRLMTATEQLVYSVSRGLSSLQNPRAKANRSARILP